MNGQKGDISDYEYYAHLMINTQSIAKDFGSQLNIPWPLEYDNTESGQYFEEDFLRWTNIGGEELFKMECE